MATDIDALLADAGWIRALARQLARDGASADDLVQETWVAALERPPRAAVPLRSWGGAVLRNLARQRRRGERRRDARERGAAGPAEEPTPAARLERLETHRLVVEAVRGLEEPYRDAILARYFEGSTPAEIARRSGVPVRTVHSHLHRGRARLRERLERSLGGPQALSVALIALAAPPRATLPPPLAAASPTILGAILVSTKLKLATAGVAVLGLGGAALLLRDPAPATPAEPRAVEAAPATTAELRVPDAPAATARRTPPPAERAAVPQLPAATAAVPAGVPVSDAVAGRVIDADGRPVAGATVVLREHGGGTYGGGDERARATTGADGRYVLETSARDGVVEVVDERWTTVFQALIWSGLDEEDEAVLVVAPPRRLAGHVVDGDGAPVVGATVETTLPEGLRGRLGEALLHARAPRWRAETDELGRFDLTGAPDVEGCRLFAERGGFRSSAVDLPRGDAGGLELVLSTASAERVLRGRVVDGAGQPVEGAYVGLHTSAARSLADGSFAIRVPGTLPPGTDVLWAAKGGLLPASARRAVSAGGEEPGAWPEPLELVLEGAPLELRGRVVEPDGTPVAGVEVRLDDPTPFGAVRDDQFGPHFSLGTDVERLLAGSLFPMRRETDEEGRFVLGGLLDRAYQLTVFDDRTLRAVTTPPLAAGRTGVEVVLPAREELEPIEGRVVALDGTPVEGAHVAPYLRLGESGHPELAGPRAETDAEGRFALEGLETLPAGLTVGGPAVGLSRKRPLDPGDDLRDLEVAVARRVRFRLDLTVADADHAELRDADDVPLRVMISRGNVLYETARFSVQEGRTETLTASEAARTLVLFADGEELRRVPVRLAGDDVVVLDG